MKKVGLIMISLILALGLGGVGYAMWSDTVTINGTVTTGSVDLDIDGLSSTYIYKVVQDWDEEPGDPIEWVVGGIICSATPIPLDPDGDGTNNLLLVSSAVATGVLSSDVANYDEDAETVTMTFTNVFPTVTCPIAADVVLHYVGSVPAHVIKSVETWTGDDAAALAAEQVEKWEVSTDDGATWTVVADPETLQLHNCHLLRFTKWFDLTEQEAADMGLSGAFTFTITAQQWNE
jgi:predicted ribosomally synthesized peptide with SipW-like signal peptide